MQAQSTIIACACGASYERREVQLPIKDIGHFECYECGARLEIWSGRKVPVFVRIRPNERSIRRA
jgi:hypothetical protein